MAKNHGKVRTRFYVEKEVLDRCDELLEQVNAKSRNEFVTEALKFYCGYLTSKRSENYLLQSLSSVLISTIRELTEAAISKRKKTPNDSEQQLYAEVMALSSQAHEIVKSLPENQQKILTDYFEKTNLIAGHECQHLYVQGAKDCVELLKKMGVL